MLNISDEELQKRASRVLAAIIQAPKDFIFERSYEKGEQKFTETFAAVPFNDWRMARKVATYIQTAATGRLASTIVVETIDEDGDVTRTENPVNVIPIVV